MLRNFLFCLLLFSVGLVQAQTDAYDQYLNQNKSEKGRQQRAKSGPAFADRYLQEVGASFNFFADPTGIISLPGIQYIGRYNLREVDDKRALSVSAHPSLGFQVDPFFGTFFMLNTPIMLEGTLGRGSTLFNEQAVGISLGVGPEFNLLNRFNQFGVSAAATFRFRLGGRGYFIRYSTSVIEPSKQVYITALSFGNSLF